jgi:pyruvate kinase
VCFVILPAHKTRIVCTIGPASESPEVMDQLLLAGMNASVDFPRLPTSVRKGNTLYLNDGIIRLEVEEVRRNDVACRVMAGGELRSRKGLNVPGVDLGIGVFTARDQECLKFALENGVDAVSQSFVASAENLHEVRRAARAVGALSGPPGCDTTTRSHRSSRLTRSRLESPGEMVLKKSDSRVRRKID